MDIINIDLSDLSIDGNILDLGYKSEGIIYRAININNRINNKEHKESPSDLENAVALEYKDKNDYNWLYGKPYKLPFDENSFDIITMFFSIPKTNLRILKRSFNEISRVLKKQGKLFLWDFNYSNKNILINKKIIVKLPDSSYTDIKIQKLSFFNNRGIEIILPILEENFNIYLKTNNSECFCIEAIKK